jgi:hypothetical protein
MSRRAHQLPLTLSIDQAVDLQEEHARAIAFAEAIATTNAALETTNAALETANAQLRNQLEAEQARSRALEQTLELAQRQRGSAERMAHIWEGICEMLRSERQTPREPAHDATLKALLFLAHPDKWSAGQPASALAHELAVTINRLREERQS